jgi:hypothetical protein
MLLNEPFVILSDAIKTSVPEFCTEVMPPRESEPFAASRMTALADMLPLVLSAVPAAESISEKTPVLEFAVLAPLTVVAMLSARKTDPFAEFAVITGTLALIGSVQVPMPAPAVRIAAPPVMVLAPALSPLLIEPVPAFKVTELVPLTTSGVLPEPSAMLPLLLIVNE